MLEKDDCCLSKALRPLGAITVCVSQLVFGRCAAQSKWTAKRYIYSKCRHRSEQAIVGVAEMLVTVQGCKKNSHSQRQAQTVQDGRDTGWQVDTVVMELGARERGLQCYSVWEVCSGNGVSSLSYNTGQK